MKRILFLLATCAVLSSCANLGVYDGKTLTDENGQEFRLNYQYAGRYFLEVKDSTGTYVPDNVYWKNRKNR